MNFSYDIVPDQKVDASLDFIRGVTAFFLGGIIGWLIRVIFL